jgi:large subunit ribosomal protein L4
MGPVVRDHSFSLNKKEKKIALKSALSSKLLEDNIVFLDTLEIKTHKTKDLVSKLNNFDFNTALFVYGDAKIDDNFKKASSNIPHVSLLSCSGINVKDLISNQKIFIDEKSIDQITKRLS